MADWDDPADRDCQAWQAAPASEPHFQERVVFFSGVATDSPFPAVRKFANAELAKYQDRLQKLRQPICENNLPF